MSGAGRDVWVIPLAAATEGDAGRKAAMLARMLAGGLPVPQGFCVTTGAFRRASGAAGHPPAVSAPPEMAEAVAAALEALGPGELAVRSSATVEDAIEASAAGLLHTSLRVQGVDAVLEAVRTCWESLAAPEAVAYMARRPQSAEPAMGVIVQRLVPAVAAGVAFTVHPLTGDRQHVVVHAVAGLADALVRGQAEPHVWVVPREGGPIAAHEPPPGTAGEPPAGAVTVSQVAALALRAEALLGSPADVEWAWDGQDVWLVQARPITALPALSCAATDREVHWTADNAQEAIPGVVTPFTESVLVVTLDEAIRSSTARMGGLSARECPPPPFIGVFDGRVYLSVTYAAAVGEALGLGADQMVGQLLGGRPPSGPPRLSLRLLRRLPLFAWCLLRLPRMAERAARHMRDLTAGCAALDLSTLGFAELLDLIEGLADRMHPVLDAVASAALAYGTAYGGLAQIVGRLPEDQRLAPTALLTGLGDFGDLAMADSTKSLAKAIRAEPMLSALVAEPVAAMVAAIRSQPPTSPARVALDGFLDRFGHMGDSPIEPACPRWREDPSSPVGAAMAMARQAPAGGAAGALPRDDRLRKARRDLAGLGVARGRLAVLSLDWMLGFARRVCQCRANVRTESVRAVDVWRRGALEAGRRLFVAGCLDEPTDVFLLRWSEIRAAVHGSERLGARETVRQRRRQLESWARMPAPRFVYQRGAHIRRVYETAQSGAQPLGGIGSSPGRVTGVARIARSLADATRLAPGEILVARTTDPSWTPYFAVCSALVTDIGSLLSHAAILAREMGLPAVVGTRVATQTIPDGTTITVDGDSGVVLLHVDPPAD